MWGKIRELTVDCRLEEMTIVVIIAKHSLGSSFYKVLSIIKKAVSVEYGRNKYDSTPHICHGEVLL